MTRLKGKVAWYNRKKGYGCILGESHREYFFKKTCLSDQYKKPSKGDIVNFEGYSETRGAVARKVKQVTP